MPEYKREINLWAIYSDDDDVVLCNSKRDAQRTLKGWRERGANGCAGPFGPFPVRLSEFKRGGLNT